MADIKITPDVYSQKATWSRKTYNKATSIVVQPLDATVSKPVDIYSETFQVSDLTSTPQFSQVYSSNTRYLNFADRQLAKGTAALQTQRASKSVRVTSASVGTPSGYLTFTGKTYEVARGGSTFDNYPTLDTMKGSYSTLVEWIKNNATSTSSSISIYDLSQNAFLVAPWVRNNITGTDTTANDVLTNWFVDNSTRPPASSSWKTSGIFGPNAGTVSIQMYPPNIWSSEDQQIGLSRLLTTGLKFTGYATATRTSAYDFNISWHGPTQILYMCASRSFGIFGGYTDIDNYAFLIDIESITFHLSSRTYGNDYSLVTYGEGTDILKLDKTVLLHNDTYKYTTYPNIADWVPQLAEGLLSALKNGKIAAQCSVPAPWAIQSKIHIGTTATIVSQDGSTLSRGNNPIQFRVARITKNFSATSFSYNLDLMEV